MSEIDLETLLTEYESARSEMEQQRRVFRRAELAVVAAQSALVAAMAEAGLTEYGPITCRKRWHEPSGTYRRTWSIGSDVAEAR